MDRLTRRDALKAATAAAIATGSAVKAQDQGKLGLTVRMAEPRNLESPFSELNSFLTPNDQFFIRSHFAAPTVDPVTHKVTVEGAIENPFEMSPADLRAMPSETKPL